MDTHQRIVFYSRTISFCCIYAYHLSKTEYRTKLAMSSYAGQLNSSLSRKLLAIVGVSSIDMRYFNIFKIYPMCNIYGELNRRFSYLRNSMQKSRLHLLYAYRLMYCCVWNAYSQWYFPIKYCWGQTRQNKCFDGISQTYQEDLAYRTNNRHFPIWIRFTEYKLSTANIVRQLESLSSATNEEDRERNVWKSGE